MPELELDELELDELELDELELDDELEELDDDEELDDEEVPPSLLRTNTELITALSTEPVSSTVTLPSVTVTSKGVGTHSTS